MDLLQHAFRAAVLHEVVVDEEDPVGGTKPFAFVLPHPQQLGGLMSRLPWLTA